MINMNVMVTGASKGIGLAFVKHFISLIPDSHVNKIIACSRNPINTTATIELNNDNNSNGSHVNISIESNLNHVALDVTSEESIKEASLKIESILNGAPIHLLINNAGQFIPYETFENVKRESFISSYDTNVAGPLFVWQSIRHLLSPNAKIVQIGSFMGSMGSISYSDGNMSYRCSKAALNMLNILLANYYKQMEQQELRKWKKLQQQQEQQKKKKKSQTTTTTTTTTTEISDNGIIQSTNRVVSVVIHPGHVQTDTGNWSRKKAPLSPDQSVDHMMRVINNLTPDDTGKFFSYDGSIIPW